MNKSFKLFLIFSCVFTNIIKTSAPLTKENLRRLQKGLPLQPKYKELPLGIWIFICHFQNFS